MLRFHNMLANFLVSLITSLIFSYSAHDMHLSVTEISNKRGKIEVVIKIFYDDLQAAMGLIPGEELPANYAGAEELITEYISKNFELILNEQVLQLELMESTALLPAVWSTFTIADFNFSEENKLEINNKLMISLFEDQKNIVKINLNDKKRDIAFSKSKYRDTVHF